ncbi:MAG: heme-binding protein [Planctomycetia bacterium]|nr:heme-binding protein [Planctomycetia bacterium]
MRSDSRTPGSSSAPYVTLAVEVLEQRLVLDAAGAAAVQLADTESLQAAEVETLLDRAAAASASQDAIIAIVDRQGHILGVRVEQGVLNAIPDNNTLVFAIDGAVALARTGAFFANQIGPLTSRTIETLSQSTITQREVESNPNTGNLGSTVQGPGLVAPIGVGGHFPPGIRNTPSADLFGIEQTNRDSLLHPGLDGIKGTADDIVLPNRFNVSSANIPSGQGIYAPESYGYASGRLTTAQSRGIATLPGGLPLYENGVLVGGIGVFFPGSDGYATHEQGFVAGVGQTKNNRINAPQVLEAEWIAFAAAGGSELLEVGALASADGTIVPAVSGFVIPSYDANGRIARIDLAGITLDTIGPGGVFGGLKVMQQTRDRVGVGLSSSGADQIVDPMNHLYLDGTVVPSGWLVTPHGAAPGSGGGSLTAADVTAIIQQGIDEANAARAQIRSIGNTTAMVFAVSDLNGNILGLYRMTDATYFSIDVAVAKARNMAYYNNELALRDVDKLPEAEIEKGTAFTARTFRYLAQPTNPEAIDGKDPGYFSSLNAPGINPHTGENLGGPLPASTYLTDSTPEFLFTSFGVGRNFHSLTNIANQSGVVYFPGSTAVYKNSAIAGGFGVSGDGVDQDDFVTFYGAEGYYIPDDVRKADQVRFRENGLPLFKFSRNPLTK